VAATDFRVTTEGVKTWVGTSGFSYPAWRGSFYPAKLPTAKMLAYYAERLTTVEINNTFYRMPKADMLAGWAKSTPESFRFAPKAPQQITHRQKLVGVADGVAYLFKALSSFGPKLGPVLFQLPPFFRKDLSRLAEFLALVPREVRVAFEFRHASWLDDAVYEALRAHDAALCIAESEDFATPLVATASWGYLRLRREDYDDADLVAWTGKLASLGAHWSDAFVYFKHEDAGIGPRLAAQFVDRLKPAALDVGG
jgi:uncharacterized protein YecE (DUF72 family)